MDAEFLSTQDSDDEKPAGVSCSSRMRTSTTGTDGLDIVLIRKWGQRAMEVLSAAGGTMEWGALQREVHRKWKRVYDAERVDKRLVKLYVLASLPDECLSRVDRLVRCRSAAGNSGKS